MPRLFVYGSLKRAGKHHAELRGARFLGEARTVPGYALAPADEYLALVAQEGAGSVPGELFEVDEALLALLDDFEGDGYARGTLAVQPSDAAAEVVAIAYFGAR